MLKLCLNHSPNDSKSNCENCSAIKKLKFTFCESFSRFFSTKSKKKKRKKKGRKIIQCCVWRERKIQQRMWKNEEIHVGFWKVTGRKKSRVCCIAMKSKKVFDKLQPFQSVFTSEKWNFLASIEIKVKNYLKFIRTKSLKLKLKHA